MIQIRNVPEELHRELKSRAAIAGQSLSEYLLSLIRQASEKVSPDEMRAILATRERHEFPEGETAAEIIRARRGPLP